MLNFISPPKKVQNKFPKGQRRGARDTQLGRVEVETSTLGQGKCDVLAKNSYGLGLTIAIGTTGVAVTKRCSHMMFCPMTSKSIWETMQRDAM